MSFPHELPFFIDLGNFFHPAFQGENSQTLCHETDICNPSKQEALLKSGIHAVCIPSIFSSRIMDGRYNADTFQACICLAKQHGISIAAELSPPTDSLTSFTNCEQFERVYHTYLAQATHLKKAGATLLVIGGNATLNNMRASIMAAQKVELPIFLALPYQEICRKTYDQSFLSALITLQSLRADAIGLMLPSWSCIPPTILEDYKLYSQVPLFLLNRSNSISIDDFKSSPPTGASTTQSLMSVIIMANFEREGQLLNSLQKCFRSAPSNGCTKPQKIEACTIENNVYFIGDNIELTEPISCSYHLEEDLIRAENKGANVIRIELQHTEDVDMLLESAHSSRMPICILTHQEHLLESILRYFPGRLMIDTSSEISPISLKRLSEQYGAMLY